MKTEMEIQVFWVFVFFSVYEINCHENKEKNMFY